MNFPDELLYTKEHEWILVDNDAGKVGITEYAQEELGDVVFAELPETGQSFQAHEPFGSLESVKAVSEVYMPVSGTVREINEELIETPELVNEDPYERGWLMTISLDDESELEKLMSAQEYASYVSAESEVN